MVMYIDQRPTRTADTLREQMRRLRVPASTPHGIKIATAAEATLYMDAGGTTRRWDGDTIASFDARLSEATKVVAKANETLVAAERNLVEAERRIAAVEAGSGMDDDTVAAKAVAGIKKMPSPPFDGRNLIVPGTLDVKQLNVTEELAASVVRAMSAETKKLVVTEDAILQRATVIENIVTPEVIAQRIRVEDIAAEMMTSSLLQTDRDARRGMKLNNAGISAFNAAGEQTVKIDASGTDNYIRGVFSTAADDKAGLTIRTTQGPISGGESIIEMRPLDATQRAPIGIIRMSPQGALHLGMKPFGTADSETKGFFVDPQGGVNITDSLRINKNMRLDGLWSMTKNMWVRSAGPYRIESGKWVEVRFSWPELDQQPFLLAQAFGSQALVTTMTGVNRSSGLLRIYNIGRDVANDVWADVYLMPFNRSTPAP